MWSLFTFQCHNIPHILWYLPPLLYTHPMGHFNRLRWIRKSSYTRSTRNYIWWYILAKSLHFFLTWSAGHLQDFLFKQHLRWSDTSGLNWNIHMSFACHTVYAMTHKMALRWKSISITVWLALFYHRTLRAIVKLCLNFTDTHSHFQLICQSPQAW